jgi:tetratricopeptide (TPR) repeat protein
MMGGTMRSFLATAIACGLLLSPGQRDAAADAAAAASYYPAAASYYRAALRGDPRNNELLGRTFLAVLANGEVEESVKLAERILQVDKNDRIARLVLGVRAIKQKQYPLARKELAQSIRGPITDLAATLLSAWTMANPAEAKQAIDSIDKLAGAEWYAIFKELHSALILDVAGKDAAKHFERSYKLDPTALRVVQAYGSFLARQGNTAEALKVFAAFDEARPRHPLIVEAVNELKAGKKLPMMVDTPQAGAAEVLYELGAALGRRGGEDLALIYLQLSLYLAPSYPLALLSLGDLYEAMPPKVRVDDGLVKSKDFKRYVASGTGTVLGFYTGLNPGCTASGIVTIRVVKQPEHGSIEIVETIGFPNYLGSLARCNQQKVQGVLVTYKSTPKFIGKDASTCLL